MVRRRRRGARRRSRDPRPASVVAAAEGRRPVPRRHRTSAGRQRQRLVGADGQPGTLGGDARGRSVLAGSHADRRRSASPTSSTTICSRPSSGSHRRSPRSLRCSRSRSIRRPRCPSRCVPTCATRQEGRCERPRSASQGFRGPGRSSTASPSAPSRPARATETQAPATLPPRRRGPSAHRSPDVARAATPPPQRPPSQRPTAPRAPSRRHRSAHRQTPNAARARHRRRTAEAAPPTDAPATPRARHRRPHRSAPHRSPSVAEPDTAAAAPPKPHRRHDARATAHRSAHRESPRRAAPPAPAPTEAAAPDEPPATHRSRRASEAASRRTEPTTEGPTSDHRADRPPRPFVRSGRMSEIVKYESSGRVAIITLNRPDARNAVNGDVATGLEAAVDRLEADEHVWVGILAANTEGQARPVFCAGADLKAINSGERRIARHEARWLRRIRLPRAQEADHRRRRRASPPQAAARSSSPPTSSSRRPARRSASPRRSAT